MKTSKITNLKFPFLIHKRNKGHAEVLGVCSFEADSNVEAYEFLLYLTKYARTLITPVEFSLIFEELKDYFSITYSKFQIDFSHFLDRASINYLISPFELRCSYLCEVTPEINRLGMSITLPVPFKEYNNFMGELTYTVIDSKTLFFEDLFDFVLKNCSLRIYPILSNQEANLVSNLSNLGKNPWEYVKLLQQPVYGDHGQVSVVYNDIYSMYNLEVSEKW